MHVLLLFCKEYINNDDVIGYCLYLINIMRGNLAKAGSGLLTGLTGLSMMSRSVFNLWRSWLV